MDGAVQWNFAQEILHIFYTFACWLGGFFRAKSITDAFCTSKKFFTEGSFSSQYLNKEATIMNYC
jgi:hypothetical protein